ncbi:MAG: PIN domain-containing protein [Actinomycetota bacterium]|nr:PIN domain-containing protein [Actinomycetota bacterium]
MARTRRSHPAKRLILDSGAVIGLSRGNHAVGAFLRRSIELDVPVEIPVVVLAETVRGTRRDAPIDRVLKAIGEVPDTTAAVGRRAGRLLGETQTSATIDALIVAHAIEVGGGAILTSDPTDFRRLSETYPEVEIHAV